MSLKKKALIQMIAFFFKKRKRQKKLKDRRNKNTDMGQTRDH